MPLALAQSIVAVVELYLATGAAFVVVFLWRGITDVDHRVAGAPMSLRVLILPGLVALWPVFAMRWATGASEPAEHNPHRVKATAP